MLDPFVKTRETSRMETRQGPDWITQGSWHTMHSFNEGSIHKKSKEMIEQRRRNGALLERTKEKGKPADQPVNQRAS